MSESAGETELIPLFPLNTVLVPGVNFPMRIFEPRYLALLDDLGHGGSPVGGYFGIVAPRTKVMLTPTSTHAGPSLEIQDLYAIGTTARIEAWELQQDGTSLIETVGEHRFAIRGIEASMPYARAHVEYLDEPVPGPSETEQAQALSTAAASVFEEYLALLSEYGVLDPQTSHRLLSEVLENIDDPSAVSHLITATSVLPNGTKQKILEVSGVVERLRTVLRIVGEERNQLRIGASLPLLDTMYVDHFAN